VKFLGIEDIATFQAFNILGVFVSGDNSNPRVFAGGNHRIWAGLDLKTLAADCSELFDNFKRHFSESLSLTKGKRGNGLYPSIVSMVVPECVSELLLSWELSSLGTGDALDAPPHLSKQSPFFQKFTAMT
jgi:hypothetical protein